MEGTGAIRPVAGTSVSPAPRDQNAEMTTLPRGKSVAAAEESAESRLSDKQLRYADGRSGEEKRSTEIDPETRQVLLKIVDTRTGLVRWQVPAETILNMRAYTEQEAQAAAEATDANLPGARLARDL